MNAMLNTANNSAILMSSALSFAVVCYYYAGLYFARYFWKSKCCLSD